jgi:hypothetical protein
MITGKQSCWSEGSSKYNSERELDLYKYSKSHGAMTWKKKRVADCLRL